jgi:hypothetical protein
VPDWDNTESRERDEDAAWRDLVARFDAPLTAQQPVPWPAREDMSPPPAPETDGAGEADGARGSDGKHRGAEIDGLDSESGRHAADAEPGRHAADGQPGRHAADEDGGLAAPHGTHTADEDRGLAAPHGTHTADEDRGLAAPHGTHTADEDRGLAAPHGTHTADEDRGLAAPHGTHESDRLRPEPGGMGGVSERHGRLEADGARDPEVIQVPRRIRGPMARGVPADGTTDDDEHYIPPTPPPLPKLDPVTKGAWAALFGGPGYLMVATAAGWSVSGLAAFCAVAAFVAGFAILVLRMHEPGPGGPDDGDDGAVV